MAPEAYVRDLARYIGETVKRVQDSLEAEYKKKLEKLAVENTNKNRRTVEKDDIVLLRKPPVYVKDDKDGDQGGQAVSKRLQPLTDTKMYRVHKFVGPSTVILADPDTGATTNLGFDQPVAITRLVPLDLHELEAPIDADTELWLEIKSHVTKGGDETWLTRRIDSQSATGRVTLVSADGN